MKSKQNYIKYNQSRNNYFSSKNKRITNHLNFQINEQKVEPCTKGKYLGIILHERNTHINILNTKIVVSMSLRNKSFY